MSPAVTALVALLAFAGGLLFAFLLRGRPLAALQAENDRLRAQQQEQALQQGRQQAQLEAAAAQEARVRTELARLQEEYRTLQAQLQDRDKRLAAIAAQLRAEQDKLAAQAEFIRAQESSLKLQFEQLATRIFEEKAQKFSEQNKTGLDGLLNPLREQLKDFRDKVETVYGAEARERFALKEQIARLEGLNRQISDEAGNLARALKGDKKLQGNWGEVILARVLEESGLRAGHEYVTQFATVDEAGKRRLPDAVIRLPEGRDIVVDSKVSLNDYVAYCAAEAPEERERLLKAHTAAVRRHVQELSEKRYEDLAELRTLDFVFLFMPVEAAFMLAVEEDPALFREAFDRKIVIVSPTTLLATLRTVESIWRYERQNRNAERIAKEAGLLHDKFVVLMGHLDDLGRALDRGQEIYRKTQASLNGHGGLVGRVHKLHELGARTKKSLAGARGGAPLTGPGDEALADESDTETAE